MPDTSKFVDTDALMNVHKVPVISSEAERSNRLASVIPPKAVAVTLSLNTKSEPL